MPADTLQRFREKTQKLGSTERLERQGELLEKIRADAVAVIALASKIRIVSERKDRLEQLLEEMRATSEELRAALEGEIATTIALADEAVGIWEAAWEEAVGDPTRDRVNEGQILRGVLGDAEQALRETLRRAQEEAPMFQGPLARLDELQARAAEFPLWTRECLARWEMLDHPAPTLDPERIARAHAAYARGEHEDMDEVLSRVQAGGPWVKE